MENTQGTSESQGPPQTPADPPEFDIIVEPVENCENKVVFMQNPKRRANAIRDTLGQMARIKALKANHERGFVFLKIELIESGIEDVIKMENLGEFRVKIRQPYRQTVTPGVLQGVHTAISVEYIEKALQENNIKFARVIRMHGLKEGHPSAA